MARRDDIPKTDPSEIEALIQRLKQSNLEPRDAQLVERLLRLVLSMASLIQHKNASIKRLKRLIFGPSSDQRLAGQSNEDRRLFRVIELAFTSIMRTADARLKFHVATMHYPLSPLMQK